ncbi:Histidine-containing phosphotransfer protein 3, partial [Rhizophlyctis rosea]
MISSGSDGFDRPRLSKLACIVKKRRLGMWVTEHEEDLYELYAPNPPRNIICHILNPSGGVTQLNSWHELAQTFIRHTYFTLDTTKICVKGIPLENSDPFPIAQYAQSVPVEDDDPRVGLRGHKKVVATQRIKRHQIIGIYEGEVLFEMELSALENILNRVEMEYKSIDYESYKSLEHEIDPDYAAHLGLTRGKYEEGTFKFSDPLVCNGGMAKGYYQWTTEVNDYRENPLAPASQQREDGVPNVKFMEVLILGWPYIFIMSTMDIAPGTELTLCYGEAYWTNMKNHVRDAEVLQKIVRPVADRVTRMDEQFREAINCQEVLLRSLRTIVDVVSEGMEAPSLEEGLRDLLDRLKRGGESAKGQARKLMERLQSVEKLLEPFRGKGVERCLSEFVKMPEGLEQWLGGRKTGGSVVIKEEQRPYETPVTTDGAPDMIHLHDSDAEPSVNGFRSPSQISHSPAPSQRPLSQRSTSQGPSFQRVPSPPPSVQTQASPPFLTQTPATLLTQIPSSQTISTKSRRSTDSRLKFLNLRARIPYDHQTALQKACIPILDDIIKQKDSQPFLEPVDLSTYHWYIDIVSKPMDLSTISTRVLADKYTTLRDFAGDVMLIWENCMKFNEIKSKLWDIAEKMKYFCIK